MTKLFFEFLIRSRLISFEYVEGPLIDTSLSCRALAPRSPEPRMATDSNDSRTALISLSVASGPDALPTCHVPFAIKSS